MSTLNGNWHVYQDPTFERPKAPAGADLHVRVESIAALRQLFEIAAPVNALGSKFRALFGRAKDDQILASFKGSEFRVVDGRGEVVDGVYEVEGLRINEGYEAFLLNLWWGSKAGWVSEMHAVALASDRDKEVRWDYDES